MSGRIRRQQVQAQMASLPLREARDIVCPLCHRPVPVAQQDAHHLVPKSHGGTATVVLHRICHRHVHALLTETELARQFNTIEALLTQKEMVVFLKWVSTKPDGFFQKSRKSQRLKRR